MTAWQKKEKPLSEEEAIALARSQLAPLWEGAAPRFAAIRQPSGQVTVHPLDQEFIQGAWMVFFVDPLCYQGQAFMRLAREWHKRYSSKSMGCIAVIRVTCPFQLSPGYLASLRKQAGMQFPLVLDPEANLASAFRAISNPWVLLIDAGKPTAAFGADDALGKGEATVQKFLRSRDPGLPLAPLMEGIEGALLDVSRFDFRDPEAFPKPGIVLKPGAAPEAISVATGDFGPVLPEARSYPSTGFAISGTWTRDESRIITTDPEARISFRCLGTHVALIAESLARDAANPAEIVVELDEKPVFDAASGADLEMTDEGKSVLSPEVAKPRILEALAGLPEKNRNVSFRFPGADAAPVALYGIRVGKLL